MVGVVWVDDASGASGFKCFFIYYLHVLNITDETRNKIPDEVSELSVPYTHFDRQPHSSRLRQSQPQPLGLNNEPVISGKFLP